MPTPRAELLQRIIPKIQSTAPDECWVWKGAKANSHTPIIWRDGRKIRVTRFLLSLKVERELTDSEQARHSCENTSKLCVNPNHLYVRQI